MWVWQSAQWIMGESLWLRKAGMRICEASAALSRIHEHTGLWLCWLRLSDSGSTGHFCDEPRPSAIHKKKKKKYICLEEQNLESILALPRLSGKAPRWGQSQHFERLCKAQILYPAPDPGDTTALRTEQGKEKQIYQDVSQWQKQRTPEGMADTFCSSGPLENWKYLLGASQRR